MLSRRTVLIAISTMMIARPTYASRQLPNVLAYRNPGCGCCENWAKLMERAGFPIKMIDDPDLAARRGTLGVPEQLAGCHLAQIGRYVIDGHVPVEDILRLLNEQPSAMGLAVPGMPLGSPGMETTSEPEKYEVFIFYADGKHKVFSRH